LPGEDPTQRDGIRLVVRALIGGVLIALSTAAAVTAAVLLEVKESGKRIFPAEPLVIPERYIPPADPGGPRTFLLLGSDERAGDRELDIKPRSDTMLLLRADPDAKVITVTSVPRDLRMPVSGYAPRTGKINEAYELKGAAGVVKALKALFEYAGAEPLKINHVVNVNFAGFRRAVDYLGGVYVDVDRRYFNDVSGPGGYATIDVQPGYQRLRGQDALDYVRYRHNDDDFIRAARQQDFLRQVKSQPSVRRLLRVQDRKRLGDVFGGYIRVDKSFKSTKTLLGLLKLGAFMDGSVVQTVRFRATPNEDGSYVDATSDQLRETLERLLHPKPRTSTRPRAPRRSEKAADYLEGLDRLQRPPVPRLAIPFYVPSHVVPGSRLIETRKYRITTLKGRRHPSYRMVFGTGSNGEYYGVQGTRWQNPPALVHPDRIRKVRGRRLLTFSDGRRLRMVGWRTGEGAFWVTNTLNRALSNREMLGVAASLRELTR
jgi:LCP family protein required for cell wall assembly